jgi:hypothetical protein
MTIVLRSILFGGMFISAAMGDTVLLAGAAEGAGASSSPLGQEQRVAFYRIDHPEPLRSTLVQSFTLGYGPVEREGGRVEQWMHLRAAKADGTSFRCWLLCERYPSEELAEAQAAVTRYILQEGDAEPMEFRDRTTGRAVLPVLGAWKYLIPRAEQGSSKRSGFPEKSQWLGHVYSLDRVEPGTNRVGFPQPHVLNLRSDVLLGVPHNTRQADDTRRFDGSDYQLVRLGRGEYDAMIQAGMNCLYVDAEQQRWIEYRDVYYWGGDLTQMPYPECLYRSTYLGPTLFLDEPAVVTRDYVIRPKLKDDPQFGHNLTPQIVLEAFRDHFHKAKYDGGPGALIRALSGRKDVDVGHMTFLQENLYTWETMISTGLHQLTEGGAPPPAAIVFEPPGQLGTKRTLPEMDMAYGCQIPVDNPANLAGILYGFLRGAARLSGREWGTSIYGAVDPADSAWLLTYAYDLGATRFFFWDTAGLACVPFSECLALSRRLREHIESRPPRELARLKQAAESLILLPPGYNLGHVHMGKGSLWGLGELNLERTNRYGITYREVMHNFFTEIERCIRLGTAYDLAWDLSGIEPAHYREVVHIREDGQVEVVNDTGRAQYHGARVPARPEGPAPELAVSLATNTVAADSLVTAIAFVTEHNAPVFYTAHRDSRGVYQNAVVFWELFGPRAEDYRVLLMDRLQERIHRQGASYTVPLTFRLTAPGEYRLRAAVADAAGRSTVVWKTITAR